MFSVAIPIGDYTRSLLGRIVAKIVEDEHTGCWNWTGAFSFEAQRTTASDPTRRAWHPRRLGDTAAAHVVRWSTADRQPRGRAHLPAWRELTVRESWAPAMANKVRERGPEATL